MTRRLTWSRLYRAAWVLLVAGCTGGNIAAPGGTPLPPDTEYPLAVRAQEPATRATSIPVVLVNNGSLELGYNLCLDGRLERLTGRGWIAIAPDPLPCPLLLRNLPPGDSVVSSVLIPAAAPAGTYRLWVQLRTLRTDDAVIRRSNAVAVRR